MTTHLGPTLDTSIAGPPINYRGDLLAAVAGGIRWFSVSIQAVAVRRASWKYSRTFLIVAASSNMIIVHVNLRTR